MGKILIFLILITTIPRWAMTLAQVDDWQIWGVPITAIGEGIALEIACYYLVRVHSDAAQAMALYVSRWAQHDEAMKLQGKQNHKPKEHPELKGYRSLMGLFYLLFVLTLLTHAPFIMSQLTGTPTRELLSMGVLWAYAFLLVVSPEAVTVGIARALHFERVTQRVLVELGSEQRASIEGEQRQPWWLRLARAWAEVRETLMPRATLVHSGEPPVRITVEPPVDDANVARELLGAVDHAIQDAKAENKLAKNGERYSRELELWRADPLLTQAGVAERLGMSRQTVGRDFAEMSAMGMVKRNGQGVEVLPSRD